MPPPPERARRPARWLLPSRSLDPSDRLVAVFGPGCDVSGGVITRVDFKRLLFAVVSEFLHVVLNAMHPKGQRETERNRPERTECTSGLAARRAKAVAG